MQPIRIVRKVVLATALSLSGFAYGQSVDPTFDAEFIKGDAERALAEMEDYRTRLAEMQKELEKNQNTELGVECVQGNLQRVETLVTVAKRALGDLKTTLYSDDFQGEQKKAKSDFEYRKIVTARAKAKELYAEADICVGGDGADQDQAEVTVTSGEITESEQPSSMAEGMEVVGTDPPNTSPFE